MAKGTIAKSNIEKIIQDAFGENYIGIFDKKIYVWADDGGQKVQIAISMTCPKNEVEITAPSTPIKNGGWDFEAPAAVATTGQVGAEPAEITAEEKANLAILLERLGM